MPADVINQHEFAEETMLMKKLTAGLCANAERNGNTSKEKVARRLYPSRSESRKDEQDKLSREVKRSTSECTERTVETSLRKFEEQLDDDETRMADKILKECYEFTG